jgi:hypothetical protein
LLSKIARQTKAQTHRFRMYWWSVNAWYPLAGADQFPIIKTVPCNLSRNRLARLWSIILFVDRGRKSFLDLRFVFLASRPYGYIAHSTSCHLLQHMGVETYSTPASGHTSQQDGNSKFVIFK